MKKYEEYKDTGVKWIPKIPKHWGLEPFGRHFSYGKGLPITKADLLQEGVAVISYGQIHSKLNHSTTISTELVRYVSPIYLSSNPNSLLESGDFVFADTSEDIEGSGNFAYNDYEANLFAGYHTVVARPKDLGNTKYYAYLFLSKSWKNQVQSLVNGVKVYSIGKRHLKKSILLIPPVAEQEKIVNFLDNKTNKINAYVTERERELQLLNELKESEIANVITRGLNPDVKMKDSGIPWIGEIPEHWEVKRIKAILSESKEKTNSEGGTLLSLSQYTGVTLKENTKKVGMFEAESTIGYNIVKPGQFVMNIMLAWNGSYAVSDYEGVISPAYCVFNFNVECERKYFHYLLRLKSYAGAFKTQSKGIIDSRLRLYPQYFLAFKTIIPPLEEQKAIVEYIEEKCNKINSLITELEAEIEYLKEYKQKLIADCVTGQINVQSEI